MAEKSKREKAEHAGRAGVKAASGNYVGAGIEIIEGFGDDIKRIVTIIVAIIVIPIIMLVAVFDQLPGLIISNFADTIGSSLVVDENKIAEWSVKKANQTIIDTFSEIEKDVSKEIIKEIKDDYIPKWDSEIKKYWNHETNPTLNNLFTLAREKDSNSLMGYQLHTDKNAEMYTMFRFKDVTAKEVNLDSIYFLCAYSVWHQDHDLVNDPANDDNDGYVETSDKEKRWTSFDTTGLKKFIRNNRKTLLYPEFTYSDEYIVQKRTVLGEDDEAVSEEYYNVPIKVLNVQLHIASKTEINELFTLNADQEKEVELYCELAKALFESAYEGSTKDLNYSFEPMSKVLKNVFGINATSKTKIYQIIETIPEFRYIIHIEDSNAKRFNGDYQSILDQLNEEWDEAHPPRDEKLGYPTKYRYISAYYPVYPSGGRHTGIDFPCPVGTDVNAAFDGTVIYSGWNIAGYGNCVVLKHDYNGKTLYTLYAHNSELKVNISDKVKKGDVIALSGNTGNSTGPHCHFSVLTSWLFRNYDDPLNYLSDD